MGKSNWFDTVFLPSLFEYVGKGRTKRISEKQANCFVSQRGVEEIQHTGLSYYGSSYVVCTEYQYNWNGRPVSLFCTKRGNELSFGMTQEENSEFMKERKKEELFREFEKARILKRRRPEKFNEKLESAQRNLLTLIRCFDASAASEDEEDLEDTLYDLEAAEMMYYKYYFA